jgi:hypothetical protein
VSLPGFYTAYDGRIQITQNMQVILGATTGLADSQLITEISVILWFFWVSMRLIIEKIRVG